MFMFYLPFLNDLLRWRPPLFWLACIFCVFLLILVRSSCARYKIIFLKLHSNTNQNGAFCPTGKFCSLYHLVRKLANIFPNRFHIPVQRTQITIKKLLTIYSMKNNSSIVDIIWHWNIYDSSKKQTLSYN